MYAGMVLELRYLRLSRTHKLCLHRGRVQSQIIMGQPEFDQEQANEEKDFDTAEGKAPPAGPPPPVKVATEQTYTFHKASMETVCGISLLSSLQGSEGAFIADLNSNGLAAGCGLQVGDTVLSINGVRVTSQHQGVMLLKSAVGEPTASTRPSALSESPEA